MSSLKINNNLIKNKKILWINNNLDVDLSAQTINIDLSKYKKITIIVQNQRTSSEQTGNKSFAFFSSLIPGNNEAYGLEANTKTYRGGVGNIILTRRYQIFKNRIEIESGYFVKISDGSGSLDNSSMKLYQIIGEY